MPVGLTLRYCLRGRIELLGIGRTARGDEPHRETIAGQVTRLNYTTWKNDNLRAGQQLKRNDSHAQQCKLRPLWNSVRLARDGCVYAVYAQPLYLSNLPSRVEHIV